MCFYIDPKHPNKKIAKRSITCYKVLHKNWHSQYQDFPYEINKLYTHPYALCEELRKGGEFKVINLGYHSYSNKKDAIFNKEECHIVVKCIIPEGAEYYYDAICKEYVSNQIIIQEVIK